MEKYKGLGNYQQGAFFPRDLQGTDVDISPESSELSDLADFDRFFATAAEIEERKVVELFKDIRERTELMDCLLNYLPPVFEVDEKMGVYLIKEVVKMRELGATTESITAAIKDILTTSLQSEKGSEELAELPSFPDQGIGSPDSAGDVEPNPSESIAT